MCRNLIKLYRYITRKNINTLYSVIKKAKNIDKIDVFYFYVNF